MSADWEGGTLVGFEITEAGTFLGRKPSRSLVLCADSVMTAPAVWKGALQERFGCYLHGPVLPKNPSLADRIIELAMERRYGESVLVPLDDSMELHAHVEALSRR